MLHPKSAPSAYGFPIIRGQRDPGRAGGSRAVQHLADAVDDTPMTQGWEINGAAGPAGRCVIDSGECGEEPTTVVDFSSGTPEILRRVARRPLRGSSSVGQVAQPCMRQRTTDVFAHDDAGRVVDAEPRGRCGVSRAPVPLGCCEGSAATTPGNARDGCSGSATTRSGALRRVRRVVEKYAGDGVVLDLGCSPGILQEGLRYGRYCGVDSAAMSLDRPGKADDHRSRSSPAMPPRTGPTMPPRKRVLNEVIYYLPTSLPTVQRQARFLAPGGVMVISLFARAWSCRRLLRRISARLELVETALVTSGHLAWTVAVFRPRA